jgi:hypothetical protein
VGEKSRGQSTEARVQRTDGRGQRTENRAQTTEYRGPNSDESKRKDRRIGERAESGPFT